MIEVKIQTDDGTIIAKADQIAELPDECLGMASFYVEPSDARKIREAYQKRGGWAIAWWNGFKSHADPSGYSIDTYYDGDAAHVILRSKRHGFMPSIGSNWVFYWLTRKHITTPVIVDWAEGLKKAMLKKRYIKPIKPPRAVGCKPAILEITNDQLDQIVQANVRNGSFVIPE